MLLDDALAGVELVRALRRADRGRRLRRRHAGDPAGRALPEREVTLLEAERRKADFLERWTAELPNLQRDLGPRRGAGNGRVTGVAVAKALAQPPVAAEWCLPLVAEGGAAILWVGPSAELERGARSSPGSSRRELEESPPGFVVLRKTGADAPGLPAPAGDGEEASARLGGRGSALRSRMPLNSSVEATTVVPERPRDSARRAQLDLRARRAARRRSPSCSTARAARRPLGSTSSRRPRGAARTSPRASR